MNVTMSTTDDTQDSAPSYAGDITPQQAHDWQQQGQGVIIDVRTSAEHDWVGFVPGSETLPWKEYPTMEVNPSFDQGVQQIAARHAGKSLLCLGRSGARSIEAATRATALGLGPSYNILEGFEGSLDAAGHRGQLGGWRYRGLPWQQK